MGFGKAQIFGVLACAIIEMAEGSELMVMGFLNPILQSQWGISDT